MSPRSKQQFEVVRQEKRQLIMAASLDLFANKGYQSTSITDITKKAGISKGLLYNYFCSKEELFREIYKEAAIKAWRYFDPDKDGILTIEEFFFYLRKTIQLVKEEAAFWKLFTALMLQPKSLQLLDPGFVRSGSEYATMIEKLFRSSGCDDPEEELMLLSCMLEGFFIQFTAMPNIFPADKFEKKIISYYEKLLLTNKEKENR